MLAGQPAVNLSFEGFEDSRLIEILEALSPDERAVAMGRSRRGVTSWPEAAMAAGVPEAQVVAVANQVRRKVKRLAARITSGALEAGAGTGNGR